MSKSQQKSVRFEDEKQTQAKYEAQRASLKKMKLKSKTEEKPVDVKISGLAKKMCENLVKNIKGRVAEKIDKKKALLLKKFEEETDDAKKMRYYTEYLFAEKTGAVAGSQKRESIQKELFKFEGDRRGSVLFLRPDLD